MEIKGPGRTRRAKVFDVPDGLGIPGKEIHPALEGVTERDDVRREIYWKKCNYSFTVSCMAMAGSLFVLR